MTSTRKMRRILRLYAKKYGFDLNDSELEFWIGREYISDRMVIQRWAPKLISIEWCYDVYGEWVGSPRLIFFTDGMVWEPIEYIGANMAPRVCALLSKDLDRIIAVNPETQAWIERRVEEGNTKLLYGGWYEKGQRVEADHELVPRQPEVLTPPSMHVFVFQQFKRVRLGRSK